MAKYIVIRRAPDLPEDFYIGDLDGKWLDVDPLMGHPPLLPAHLIGSAEPGAVAVPTGCYETREDGAAAEVYEVRP